ncbi:MAG: hypothetical protein KA116_03480 [Proteobacteria bacterium]|nr:hypothetical protein [Pseudomonadota bacterium]
MKNYKMLSLKTATFAVSLSIFSTFAGSGIPSKDTFVLPPGKKSNSLPSVDTGAGASAGAAAAGTAIAGAVRSAMAGTNGQASKIGGDVYVVTKKPGR